MIMQKTADLADENNSTTISYNGIGTAMNNGSGDTNYDPEPSNGRHKQQHSRSGSEDTFGVALKEFTNGSATVKDTEDTTSDLATVSHDSLMRLDSPLK